MSAEEKKFASACYNYYTSHIKNNDHLISREKLYSYTKSFYDKHIGINFDKYIDPSIKKILKDPNSVLIEVAHDGQIPHLGIVRMVLKTYHISRLLPNSLVLYFIGDHYSANMCRESTLFGIPQLGKPPEHQKNPVVFRIGKDNQHVPLKWVSQPSEKMISEVEKKINDWITNNISYEKKRGHYVNDKVKIKENLHDVMQLLRNSSKMVDNYADWMIRVQYLLFKQLMGEKVNNIIFLPFSHLYEIVGDEYKYLLRQTEKINQIKKEVSREQIERGIIPYQKSDLHYDTSCFWVYCPNCRKRGRASRYYDNTLKLECGYCGTSIENSIDNLWDTIMPDIVCFECGLFRLGVSGWLVGSKAPYQEVIERVYTELYESPMPPRFLLESKPLFKGVGDPELGYGRTTLLRALLEVSSNRLFKDLMAPWNEEIKIKSEFLI